MYFMMSQRNNFKVVISIFMSVYRNVNESAVIFILMWDT